MKKILLRLLFFLIPFLWSIYSSAQPGTKRNCDTHCFSSEVVSVQKLSATCTAYEMNVSYSGQCAHALSHFSVAIPCGEIESLWNSQDWKQETGTDPTTGIQGFKIDDIPEFGEGGLSSFTVKFTLCTTDEDCNTQLACWQPVVAYKAATCVNYDTLAIGCARLKASLAKQDVTCFGRADGSLTVTVEEGQGPFTYEWSDQSTDPVRTNLPAGDYSVTIRDALGSELTLHESISQPGKIAIGGETVAARCNGMADGSVDITVSGGAGGYSFRWSNGSEEEDLQSLASGVYSVTITDQTGCRETAVFVIPTANTMTVTATTVRPDCNNSNGAIDITVSGGSEPYSFLWSNGATTEDLSGVPADMYTVTITDAAGCSTEQSWFIRENNTLRITGNAVPGGCSGDESGAIEITVSGGTQPYTYEWSNGATTATISGLIPGSYTVTVTDANGCTLSAGFNVTQATLTVPVTAVHPACLGDKNGSIVIGEPVGGTGPFTYEWSNGNTGSTAENLAPGNYSVTVTDATGCSQTIDVAIKDPEAITASAMVWNSDCNRDGFFGIDLQVSGGTAPYNFEWSDGSTSEDRSGLTKGSYSVLIKDANGCAISKEVTVEGTTPDWSCLISEPSVFPLCGLTGNTLTASITDADSYEWSVESTDGSWSITGGAETASLTYTAGAENTSATFTLTVTKDGCTQSCSYTLSTCQRDDGEGSGEDPGDDNDGGAETCEECFSTVATLIDVSGGCHTYEMKIATNGMCRYELSHWTLAIPCGTVSDYSNSGGWPMEYGKDPTTGLYGLKVDEIRDFGKEEDSFTVRFTLCESGTCDLSYWDPTVAYKAGQCVAVEHPSVTEPEAASARVSVYPNPFSEEIHFEWRSGASARLEIIDQYGNVVPHAAQPVRNDDYYSLTFRAPSLPGGVYYYRLTIDGRLYQGKISKR